MSNQTIHIGIPHAERKAIADGLSRLLADSYTLYLQTHNFLFGVNYHGRSATTMMAG